MQGVYINLANSTERHRQMTVALAALDMGWVRRLPAVDGNGLSPSGRAAGLSAGEHGCFVSHASAVHQASVDNDWTLVLEDDLRLSPALPDVLAQLAPAASSPYDLVFVECMPYATTTALLGLWQCLRRRLPAGGTDDAARHRISGVDLLDAPALYNWGATAYLLTPAGAAKLDHLARAALTGPLSMPFDVALREWIQHGELKAAVMAPFLATPSFDSLAASTIAVRPDHLAGDLLSGALRQVFFAGSIAVLPAQIAPYRSLPLTDDLPLRLLGDLLGQLFVLSAGDR